MTKTHNTDRRTERAARLTWVPCGLMRTPTMAQRDLKPGRVDHIAANMDLEQLGTPTVNKRAGLFYILDGQHRVEAFKQWIGEGWENQQLQCWTYDGLSEQEEAETFLKLNDTLAVQAFDKFRIGLNANRSEEVEIAAVVSKAGLTISQSKAEGFDRRRRHAAPGVPPRGSRRARAGAGHHPRRLRDAGPRSAGDRRHRPPVRSLQRRVGDRQGGHAVAVGGRRTRCSDEPGLLHEEPDQRTACAVRGCRRRGPHQPRQGRQEVAVVVARHRSRLTSLPWRRSSDLLQPPRDLNLAGVAGRRWARCSPAGETTALARQQEPPRCERDGPRMNHSTTKGSKAMSYYDEEPTQAQSQDTLLSLAQDFVNVRDHAAALQREIHDEDVRLNDRRAHLAELEEKREAVRKELLDFLRPSENIDALKKAFARGGIVTNGGDLR